MIKYLVIFILNLVAYLLLAYYGFVFQNTVVLILITVYAFYFDIDFKDKYFYFSFTPWLIYHIPFIIFSEYNEFIILNTISFPLLFLILFLNNILTNKFLKGFLFLFLSVIYYYSSFILFNNTLSKRGLLSDNITETVDINKLGLINQIEFNKDTFYVIDCWISSCGLCFEGMPEFEKFQKSSQNPKVKFYTLNIPLVTDKKDNNKILLSKHYSGTNNLFSEKVNALSELNKIGGYPFVIIVYNNKVIFKYTGKIKFLFTPFSINLEDKLINLIKENE